MRFGARLERAAISTASMTILLALSGLADPSSAYMLDGGASYCALSRAYYKFVPTLKQNGDIKFRWYEDEKQAVRLGLEAWNAVRDRDGRQVVRMQEQQGANQLPVVEVRWAQLEGAAGRADVTNCQWIKIDRDFHDNPASHMTAIATHEMGHILGLPHADSAARETGFHGYQGPGPTMATCLPPGLGETPVLDDHAALLHRQGDWTGGQTLSANPGFENGDWFWRAGKATNLEIAFHGGTVGDPRGLRYLRVQRTTSQQQEGAGYVWTQTNIVTPFNGWRFAGSTEVRRVGGERGRVVLGLRWRPVMYEAYSIPPQDCQPRRTGVGQWMAARRMSIEPTDGWALYTSEWFEADARYSADIRIWIRNALVSESGNGQPRVAVDNLRVKRVG